MGRIQVTLAAAVLLTGGVGCAADRAGRWWGRAEPRMPEGVPTAPLSANARFDPGPVVPASATSNGLGVGRLTKLFKTPATEMTLIWRNRIDYLPDPARNGEMGPGLAGQLFLFGPNLQFVEADGKLVVALYDETPRPPGQSPLPPECWEFTKETLQKLKTADERFGMSYALFLPWPTYRPDVTRVRIAARYEPESGHPLYAPETRITLDTSLPGPRSLVGSGQPLWSGTAVPPGMIPPLPGPGGNGPGPQPAGTPLAGPNPHLAPAPLVEGRPYGSLPPAPPGYGMPLPPGSAAVVPGSSEGKPVETASPVGSGMSSPAGVGGGTIPATGIVPTVGPVTLPALPLTAPGPVAPVGGSGPLPPPLPPGPGPTGAIPPGLSPIVITAPGPAGR